MKGEIFITNSIEKNKKFYVLVNEREFFGTGIEIINEVRKHRFLGSDIELSDFILEIQQNVFRLYGKGITIPNNLSLEEKASLLVQQLIHHGLLLEIE